MVEGCQVLSNSVMCRRLAFTSRLVWYLDPQPVLFGATWAVLGRRYRCFSGSLEHLASCLKSRLGQCLAKLEIAEQIAPAG
eukprot:s5361_g1.t1